jgi:hypothetical protein
LILSGADNVLLTVISYIYIYKNIKKLKNDTKGQKVKTKRRSEKLGEKKRRKQENILKLWR